MNQSLEIHFRNCFLKQKEWCYSCVNWHIWCSYHLYVKHLSFSYYLVESFQGWHQRLMRNGVFKENSKCFHTKVSLELRHSQDSVSLLSCSYKKLKNLSKKAMSLSVRWFNRRRIVDLKFRMCLTKHQFSIK